MSDQQAATAEEQRQLSTVDRKAALASSSAELKQAAVGADARNSEAVDFVDGNVPEMLADSSEIGSSGQAQGSTATGDDATTTTASGGLAAVKIPAPRVVMRKLKTAVNSEITATESSIKTMQRRPLRNAAALVDALNTLRKMRDLLVALVEKTWDELKKLWVSLQQGQKVTELA